MRSQDAHGFDPREEAHHMAFGDLYFTSVVFRWTTMGF